MKKNASLLFLLIFSVGITLAESPQERNGKPEVFVHYMPWFDSKSVSGQWGYHWTMDHYNPDIVRWNGKREIASKDYPLIGPYDTSDLHALECHVQLMKLSGVDGVIIDWYGIKEVFDYGKIHQDTQKLVEVIKRADLKFAICYEDQTIKHMIGEGELVKEQAKQHGAEVIQWMAKNWFGDSHYWNIEEKPVLLVFGPQYFSLGDFQGFADALEPQFRPKLYFLPHGEKGEHGTFLWPPVSDRKSISIEQWKSKLTEIYSRADLDVQIGVAFPSFLDLYGEAGVQDSYGRIGDRNGETFSESLVFAATRSPFIQVATWNDFGEGTAIEPSCEKGYRYLEILQRFTGSAYSMEELRSPIELYHLRKTFAAAAIEKPELSEVASLLLEGNVSETVPLLESLKEESESLHLVFPGEVVQAPAGGDYRLVSNIPYRKGDDLDVYARSRCLLDVYYPKGHRPYQTVVWFHGGGISKGNKEIPLPLRNKGVAVVAANYRLNPQVKAPVYIEDAAAAVAWTLENIHRFGAGRADSVFVSGHSAGGYLASMVGLDPQWLAGFGTSPDTLAGLIPFSGHTITHFTIRSEMGIQGTRPLIDEFAPLYHIKKNSPPMLLITGDREKELMGRFEENAYFWRMAKVVGHPMTELRELEGYDHGDMPEPGFPLLLDFMDRVKQRSAAK